MSVGRTSGRNSNVRGPGKQPRGRSSAERDEVEGAEGAHASADHDEGVDDAGDGADEVEGGLDVVGLMDAVAKRRGGGIGKGAVVGGDEGDIRAAEAAGWADRAGDR